MVQLSKSEGCSVGVHNMGNEPPPSLNGSLLHFSFIAHLIYVNVLRT